MTLDQQKAKLEKSHSEMLTAASDPTRSANAKAEANRRVTILDGLLRSVADQQARASATA